MLQTCSRLENGERREGKERLVAVAVYRDSKSSQRALQWTVENFITRGQSVRLVHVIQRSPSNPNPVGTVDSVSSRVAERQLDNQNTDLFLPFRCFCAGRQVQCESVVLEDPDVAKALIEYVNQCGIETLSLGAASKSGLSRLFKATDIPASILKWAPDFCNVYVISKGKVAATRAATRPVPVIRGDANSYRPQNLNNEAPSVISLSRENDGLFYEVPAIESDKMSSSGASMDGSYLSFYENLGSSLDLNPHSFDPYSRRSRAGSTIGTPPEYSFHSAPKHLPDLTTLPDFSSKLPDAETATSPTESAEDVNDETRRLRLELKQTMDLYHAACREALVAKQKMMELQEWKRKEEKRMREAHQVEAASSLKVEKEKARYKAAIEAAQKFVEKEVQKREEAEIRTVIREAEERKWLLCCQSQIIVKYRSLYHILAVLFLFYFFFSL